MDEHYRADHVGSLLRPTALLERRREAREGTASSEALREEEDRAILGALAREEALGLPVVTDGEFRRGSWITSMAESMEGFVAHSREIDWHGPDGGVEHSTSQVVGGRLRERRRIAGAEAAFLAAHATRDFKVTLPAASNFYLASWHPELTAPHYPTRAAMTAQFSAVLRDEIAALAEAGTAYVQLDSPFYCSLLDASERERLAAGGLDPVDALGEMIAADNASIELVERAGLTLALHVCRGNSRSRWMAEGGYEPIAERLFNELAVDRFLLEYDSARAGGFGPLRLVPRGKVVVLGLVTTKQGGVEDADELKRRIERAARELPLEQLALSPQCGFASVAEGNLLSEDDQWRKLERVLEVANDLWG